MLCKSWEEICTSGANLALVGADYWEEGLVEKGERDGILILRLDEAYLTPYQPADKLIKEIYQIALEQQICLPGALTAG